MIRARREAAHRRPRHARPSVLAPNRRLTTGGWLVALIGLAVACAAAVADGSAGAATRGIHPAAVKGTQGALSAAQAGTTSGAAGLPALIDAPSSLAAAASSAAFAPDFAPVS